MCDDLDKLAAEIEKMRKELLQAETLFSKALDDQRELISLAEERLRVGSEYARRLGEASRLADIIATLSDTTGADPIPSLPIELRSILDGEGSPSWKSKKLTVYILEQASEPLANRAIVAEHDRLGLKVGPSAEEVLENEPGKHRSLASAERRSFTLKWGLIRKAFDERVMRLDNNTYWLKGHPRDQALPSQGGRPDGMNP